MQGRCREVARGMRPILNLETRAAGLFAWGFLDAQLVDAVVGVLGEFRPGVDEPFARRDFGLPLRRSGCRLARNVVALRARLLLRNEYFAVGKVRKGHVKCRAPRAPWPRASSWPASGARAACSQTSVSSSGRNPDAMNPRWELQKTGRYRGYNESRLSCRGDKNREHLLILPTSP